MSTTSEETCYIDGESSKNRAQILIDIRGYEYTIRILTNALTQVPVNSPHYTALSTNINEARLARQKLKDMLSGTDTDTDVDT